MRVLNISEESHGHIGLAMCYRAAIDFLTLKEWLNETLWIPFWNEEGGGWDSAPIREVLGDEWEDRVYCMTIEEFNDIFDCVFHLEVEELYE